MGVRIVKRFRSGAGMARFSAQLLELALKKTRRTVTVALPGGATPVRLFKELSAARLPWHKAVFLMSDERLVPFTSRHSNFGAARRLFFSPGKVQPASLRPARSPAAFEKALRPAAGRLDLAFIGLGADGHTASIFPGFAAWRSRRLALEVKAPAGVTPGRRVTLTPAALEQARVTVLLAAGPAKKEIFARAARGDKSIPAGRLRPRGKFYLLFSGKE
ncbi:MAG: 6-phosphogluconolactonase [Elusimicrobiales bacterium]|nr:6-phosphogluconolactonase [Elusimicrobiales bacterium]